MRLNILAEWTNECNLSCRICPISRPDGRPKGHMDLELWLKILDCCKREGHFVGWSHFFGEPLLWKHFFIGMKMWRESGLSRYGSISTNGHLLTDDRIECIAESGIKCLRICVDSLRPQVYESLRGSSQHVELITKTERFLRKAPNVPCQVQFLQSSINVDEGPHDFLKYFHGYKNLSVFASYCQNIGGDASLSVCRNPSPDPRKCTKVDYEHCVITWDGQVGLCCIDYDLLNCLGGLSGDSINEVFLGEYAEGVRSQIKEGNYQFAPYCSMCPMDHVEYVGREVF